MLRFGSDQRSTQICRNVTLGGTGDDRIAEDSPERAAEGIRCFVPTPSRDLAQDLQQFGCRKVCDRSTADERVS